HHEHFARSRIENSFRRDPGIPTANNHDFRVLTFLAKLFIALALALEQAMKKRRIAIGQPLGEHIRILNVKFKPFILLLFLFDPGHRITPSPTSVKTLTSASKTT